MFGSSRGVNEYSRVGVETGVVAADPHKLVVMLYEGAMTACHTAVMHIESKDFERKGAMISKAIMIIESGLRLSLDKKAGGEIATSLDALYGYMSDRLYMANIKNDPSLIQEVIRLLGDLKSAWEAIGTQVAPDNTQFQRVQNYAKAS